MRYSFWYGANKAADSEWLSDAVSSLQDDDWKANTPVYFDGAGWREGHREEAAIRLLDALQVNTSARSLYLRNAVLENRAQQALSDVFQKNTHLESVSLRKLRTLGGEMTIPISLFHNESLQELALERCTLDRASGFELGKMIRTSQCMTTLTLENVHLEGGITPVAAALSYSSSLRRLNLKNASVSDDDFKILLKAVGTNTSLRTLHLEGLHLNQTHASALARMLQQNSTLEELSLRKNDLDDEAMNNLFLQGLCKNTTLSALLLSHNPVGDEGVSSIVSSLQVNTSLQRLCLAYCEIWSDGCREIANGLGKMKGLRRISLDGNDVESCAPAFLSALDNNCILTEVLQCTPLLLRNVEGELDEESLALWKQVDLHLRWNKAGRRVLAEPKADVLLPYVLAKHTHQMDVVFKFLQNGPR